MWTAVARFSLHVSLHAHKNTRFNIIALLAIYILRTSE